MDEYQDQLDGGLAEDDIIADDLSDVPPTRRSKRIMEDDIGYGETQHTEGNDRQSGSLSEEDEDDEVISDASSRSKKRRLPAEGTRRSAREGAKRKVDYAMLQGVDLLSEQEENELISASEDSDPGLARSKLKKSKTFHFQRRSKSSSNESDQLEDSYNSKDESSNSKEYMESDQESGDVEPARQHRKVSHQTDFFRIILTVYDYC